MLRLARLVDDQGVDLQEVFLDTPVKAGLVRADVRVSHAQLRRGILRLLACVPPT